MITFTTGTMGAGKSARLIADLGSLSDKDVRVYSYGTSVTSRNGNSIPAKPFDEIRNHIHQWRSYTHVYIDEANLMDLETLNMVIEASLESNAWVSLYGLRTDFTGNLFPTSKRLLEVSDTIITAETETCEHCHIRFATMNARYDNDGNRVTSGDLIEIDKDNYKALCLKCFMEEK